MGGEASRLVRSKQASYFLKYQMRNVGSLDEDDKMEMERSGWIQSTYLQ